tara:strand:- start:500 stop:1183 length:684 start_codon:yes stop_codon:yes gene_type:complete
MSGGMQSGGVSKELLTTKGDTHGFSNVNQRVGIGADTQVLTADSAQALGLKWATPAGGGLLEQIESYEESAATGNTVTLNPASDINLDDYDHLEVRYAFLVTGALNLHLVLDGLTSGYRYSISEDAGGTFTNTIASSQAQFVISDSTILSTNTNRVVGSFKIYPMEQNEGGDMAGIETETTNPSVGSSWGGGVLEPFTLSSFGGLTISTSANAWYIHARFNLQGYKK